MADSRQFTDHNEVGGANVYLEDKRLAERTAVGSAAGIANLKFLLANDDTEGFNTAIKAYIDEAVRSAIGTLVDNLDKNTAISRILATDANHDLGTITPANLANVLGVRQYTYLSGANSKTYRIKAFEGCVQVAFQGNGWDGMAWLFFRNGDVNTGEPILIKGKDFDTRGSITYHDEGTAETRAYDVYINAWSRIIVTGFGVSNLTIIEQ